MGVSSGPFLGGVLYSSLGYCGIFLFVALLCSVNFLILHFYKAGTHRQPSSHSVPFWTPFTRLQTLFAILNTYVFYKLVEGLEPILPGKLKRDFSFQTQQVSHYFLAELLVALVVGLLVTFFLKLKDARKWIVCWGTLASLSHFLIGPSKLFHLPNTKEVVLSGLILNGTGFGAITPFLFAEAWRACSSEFPEAQE